MDNRNRNVTGPATAVAAHFASSGDTCAPDRQTELEATVMRLNMIGDRVSELYGRIEAMRTRTIGPRGKEEPAPKNPPVPTPAFHLAQLHSAIARLEVLAHEIHDELTGLETAL